MGLMIITDHNTLKRDEDVEVSKDCMVCQCAKDEDINDVERIFRVLDRARSEGKDINNLDSKMCEYHANKARGLKIIAHNDHLMELDATTVRKEVVDSKVISKEEYDEQVEIEDDKANM